MPADRGQAADPPRNRPARTSREAVTAICSHVQLDQLARDRWFFGGVICSLALHACAIGGARLVQLDVERPPMIIDLTVATADAGVSGSAQEPEPPTVPPSRVRSASRPPARRAAPPAPTIAPAEPSVPAIARPEPAMEPTPAPPREEAAPPAREAMPFLRTPAHQVERLTANAAARSSGADEPSDGQPEGSGRAASFAGPSGPASSAPGLGAQGVSPPGPLSAPRLLGVVKPRYPEVSRRAGIEGTVLVKAHVLADGSVGIAELRRSAGYPALDRAAVEAIRDSRFQPAERGGRPVAVWVEIPVQFRLDQ
jgi:protein TonB